MPGLTKNRLDSQSGNGLHSESGELPQIGRLNDRADTSLNQEPFGKKSKQDRYGFGVTRPVETESGPIGRDKLEAMALSDEKLIANLDHKINIL